MDFVVTNPPFDESRPPEPSGSPAIPRSANGGRLPSEEPLTRFAGSER